VDEKEHVCFFPTCNVYETFLKASLLVSTKCPEQRHQRLSKLVLLMLNFQRMYLGVTLKEM
jgi:hypothetical protein